MTHQPCFPFHINMTLSPLMAEVDFLTQKINEEKQDFGEAYPFGFFIRDQDHHIIAGCNGSVIFGCIYTDQLWVHPDHRQKGLGRHLMEAVHDYGRKSACSMATVATMSFQGAQNFYEKLGYMVDFERLGHTRHSSCVFMRKEL